MKSKKIFLNPIFLLLPILLSAQPDTLREFYRINYQLEKEYELRSHIPLDGDQVMMIPFKQDDLYGFVAKDKPEDWLVPPTFESVYAVYDDQAIVSTAEQFGVVKATGEMVVPAYFQHLEREQTIYHGLFFNMLDTVMPEAYSSMILNVYYNQQGEDLFIEQAHDQKSFNAVDSLAWFRYGTRISIRGISGKQWKQFRLNSENEFIGIENNVLIYRKAINSSYQYTGFDIHGKEKFKLSYDDKINNLVQLSPTLYLFYDDYTYFFFDENGVDKDYVYQRVFDQAKGYHQGFYQDYFPVQNEENMTMGLINRKGKQLLGFEYRFVDEVVSGTVFCVPNQPRQQFGRMLDMQGAVVADSIWTHHELIERFIEWGMPISFYDGLLNNITPVIERIDTLADGSLEYSIGEQMHFYYFDKKGEMQFELPPDLIYAGMFNEGLAPVVNFNRALGFINKQGEVVIDFQYEFLRNKQGYSPLYQTPQFVGGYAYIQPYDAYIDKNGKQFFAYSTKYEGPSSMAGTWMEVRKEGVKSETGFEDVGLEIEILDDGRIKIGEYNDPYTRYVTGKYEIQDSLILMNPQDDDGSTFRYFFYEREFVIEKVSKDELIWRTNKHYNAGNQRLFFWPKEKFETYTEAERRREITFTTRDSLKKDAYRKEYEALKELQKNDSYFPLYPGGKPALEAYIKAHIIYPDNHTKFKIIKVVFEVDAQGNISILETMPREENAYQQEAIRLIKAMPKWTPARKNGVAVKGRTSLVIQFEMR